MFEHLFHLFISFVNKHLLLVYFLVFVSSFLEFIVLIGNLFPGTTLLFTFSFLASQTQISFIWVFGLSFVGAILGDVVSYYIGKRYGKKFLKFSHLKKEEEIVEKEINKKLREGKWLNFILLGKLNSLMRSFTGFVGGVRDTPFLRFFSVILIGDFIWTIVFVFLPSSLGFLAKKYLFMLESLFLVIVLFVFILISIVDGSLKEIIEWVKDRKII